MRTELAAEEALGYLVKYHNDDGEMWTRLMSRDELQTMLAAIGQEDRPLFTLSVDVIWGKVES